MYGRQRLITDPALNDSAKEFVVPAGFEWHVDAVYVDYTASNDSGNRLVRFDVSESTVADAVATVHWRSQIAAAIIASQQEFVVGVHGTGEPTEAVATFHYVGLPAIWIPEDWIFRVWDSAAVAAAADDMLVSLWVTERSQVRS